MRIMTVQQPWAHAIAHLGKDVENRTTNIAGDYRGLVAIHAGKTYDEDAVIWVDEKNPTPLIIDESGDYREPSGAIIAVAHLWAVHRDRDGGNCCPHRPSGGPGGSPWAERDVWHLCLNEVKLLNDPIPHRGMQGLTRVNDELEARIMAQLA